MDLFNSGSGAVISDDILSLTSFVKFMAPTVDVIRTEGIDTSDSVDRFAPGGVTITTANVSLSAFDSDMGPSAEFTKAVAAFVSMDIFNSGSGAVIDEAIPLTSFVLFVIPAAKVIRTLGINTFDSIDIFNEDAATVMIATVALCSLDWGMLPVPKVKGLVPEA